MRIGFLCSHYVPFVEQGKRNNRSTARFIQRNPSRSYPMKYDQGDPKELREKFWHAMEESPIVMLQVDADQDSGAPMTAQLDKDANSAIWFFTGRDNRFAAMGPATATFQSKGHDVFCRFAGVLTEETSRERLDKQWNNFVEA
ncbi:MAG: pyridoxamine 5'-phosphate oxidase family protein, partial [Novosphingobium sp.]